MNEVEFLALWNAERDTYRAWGEFVTEGILTELQNMSLPKPVNEFIKIPPMPRVKKDSSLLEKAYYRPEKKYTEPYREITDKVGVRFVVLVERDIAVICKAVEQYKCWEASRDRDFEAERDKNPEQFGYQSVHYVVTAAEDSICGGVAIPRGTPCEVQIRTLLQHAYSELTHDTIYKPRTIASSAAKRMVSRSMAYIEGTDDLFLRVMVEIEKAEEPLRRAMESLASTFEVSVGHAAEPSRLNTLMLDAFEDRLDVVHTDEFATFISGKPFIGQLVGQRAEKRLLFRQPAILLIYYLADKAPRETKSRWPLTPSELQVIYEDLGQSFDAY